MIGTGAFIKTLLKNNFILTVTCVRLVQSSPEVRVRFAPSPTGFLHLGGLRTALYNFLFARSKGGTFILRIEDTDQTRLVEGAIEQLYEDLKWVGIVPDEGGQNNPYQQSKRLHLYKKAADALLEKGAAYHCFCTQHRLELLRKDALRRRQVPRYDSKCRNLTREEVQEKLDSGIEHCVRLKLIPGCDTFTDLVYGNITHDVAATEGDPVVFKTDGFPTYHLANVVDDHDMRITHVLRGVEWQSSTPKHLMIYKSLGWQPPQFAHLPLLLNADGSKLSKRQGDISIKHYRETDIIPRALVNFVTFSGGGFHRDNSDTVRSLDMNKLAAEFDLGLIAVASCRVSLERLDDFNLVELQRQVADEAELSNLVKQLHDIISQTFGGKLESLELDDSYIRSVIQWSLKRITRLSQLAAPQFSYLWVRPSPTILDQSQAELAKAAYDKLNVTTNFTHEALVPLLRSVAKERGVKVVQIMQLMRLLLCGLKEGPGVAEVLEMLGQQTSLSRLMNSIKLSEQNCTVATEQVQK